jgi:hypothetical protein
MTMAQAALYIGVVDASALLIMGIVSAALYLFNIEAEGFWKRVWPAVGILLATSVAAVLILLASTWISSILT